MAITAAAEGVQLSQETRRFRYVVAGQIALQVSTGVAFDIFSIGKC